MCKWFSRHVNQIGYYVQPASAAWPNFDEPFGVASEGFWLDSLGLGSTEEAIY